MQQKDEIRSISLIGAGKVGWHLAIAFKQAGFKIMHIISRDLKKAESLSVLVDSEALTSLDQLAEEPDLFLVCTQDSEIDALAGSLSSSNAIVAHTSGGIGMEVFNAKANKYGVFYPLQTFSLGDVIDYKAIPFLLEGSDPATVSALAGLAEKISGKIQIADSRTRLQVHLAAVFACNFSNHMTAIAEQLLDDLDLDIELIKPLMAQTMKKLDTMSAEDAQTGPAIRGDASTMKRHMDLLKSDPDLQEIYQKISQNIAKETDIDKK